MNKVMLLGRLTANAELRFTQAGQAVCSFTLVTNETFTRQNGEKGEITEFHRCVLWGKRGQALHQYLTKGRQFCVEGRLQTRRWEDKNKTVHYTTEIVVSNIEFGASPQNQSGAVEPPPSEDTMPPPPPDME